MVQDPNLHMLMRAQQKALVDVAELVSPWMDLPGKPLPIKVVNNTVGSAHILVSIEEGIVVLELLTRVRDPEPEVLVIPSEGEQVIDVAG